MYSFVDHNQCFFFVHAYAVGATYVFCQEIYILCCNFEFPSVLTDVLRTLLHSGGSLSQGSTVLTTFLPIVN